MEHPNPLIRRRHPKPSEEGYLLLAVMFLLAVLVLSLAAAAPNIARSIQRDRDVETMERGKQYTRAIQLYFRRFHAYPPNVDALVKTNDIRFLRKKYTDPVTGKDDWKPVLFGQNKAPIAMGFFGQPLSTGSSLAGVGPTGGNGLNGVNGSPSAGGLFNSTGGSGVGSSLGSIFGSSSSTSTPNVPPGSTGSSPTSAGSSPAGGDASTSGSNSTSGSDSNSSSSSSGPSGQTFGGAGIIGFSPASTKQSILVYKKKNHYNEWEFTYDPIMDRVMMAGGNAGITGQPASSMPGMSTPGAGIMGTPGTSPIAAPSNNGPTFNPVTPPETPAPEQ